MKKIRENAAGIDVGAKQVFVSVEGQKVKSYFTFTEDLGELVKYLLNQKVETVAMEATGVYWCILYELIEEASIDVWLVDGRETKQVPGRKTDVKDCQWIQQLHSYGLLNRCFVATEEIKELRNYQRLREDHIRTAAMHVNHMQKALIQMNIRLKEVISQIHGVSGMKIIQAILEGERDAEILLNLCDSRIIKNKGKDVLKALNGRYTKASLFALKQAYDAYYFYQGLIDQCDMQIKQVIQKMGKGNTDQYLKIKRKPIRHNKPKVDNLGANLLDIFQGTDATVIAGITDYTWMQLLSETGSDLSRWKTAKHFSSWLGLAPGQNWSGKKRGNKNKKGRPKAGQIFRDIAQSLITSKKIAIGAFGRRLRAKKGPAIAIKAMARKLAELYWKVIQVGIDYAEIGLKKYEDQIMQNKRKNIQRLAKELNMQVVVNQSLNDSCHW
jgi:transposase